MLKSTSKDVLSSIKGIISKILLNLPVIGNSLNNRKITKSTLKFFKDIDPKFFNELSFSESLKSLTPQNSLEFLVL